jgi:hypothetical protein
MEGEGKGTQVAPTLNCLETNKEGFTRSGRDVVTEKCASAILLRSEGAENFYMLEPLAAWSCLLWYVDKYLSPEFRHPTGWSKLLIV